MNFIKRFATPIQVLMTLGLFIEISIIVGIAATPGVYGALQAYNLIAYLNPPEIVRVFAMCSLAMLAYFCYTLCVIVVVPVMRITAPGAPEGRYSFYSQKAIQWASYSALMLIVRYTCINFLRVTPMIVLFHRLMGMKVGKRVQINTIITGESNLISIGDDTVIGGDVTLVAHAAENEELIVKRVTIGKRVTVGLMSVIMPGCVIGDDAVLAANTVLRKDTVIGAGEIWGGVPARKIGHRKVNSSENR